MNSWRKSLNLLSATNLIEDYDEHIPNLTTPQILATKSNASANIDATIQKYPSARLVTVNDSIMFQIANLRDEICKRLCNNSTAISAIILYRSVGSTKSSFVPEIDAENVRIEKTKSQEQRGLMVVQTVEKYKPRIGDDPFALYALSKTIIYGQEHHEAFELLSEAAEFAIKQGKAAELYQRISDDIEKDLLRKDIRDRTIWRLSTPDHKKHWLPIVTALTRNDAKLLGHD